MGNWLIASVITSIDDTCEFYNDKYFNCSKTEAIRKFVKEHPYRVLLNIIEL